MSACALGLAAEQQDGGAFVKGTSEEGLGRLLTGQFVRLGFALGGPTPAKDSELSVGVGEAEKAHLPNTWAGPQGAFT